MKIYKNSKIYGSFFGEYDQDLFFTKEEIVEFGYAVCDRLNALYHGYSFDIEDVYMEGKNNLTIYVVDNEAGIGANASIKIDMRKIRKPSDIYKYLDSIVNDLGNEIFTYISEQQAYEGQQTKDIKGAIFYPSERRLEPPDPEEYEILDDTEHVLEIDFEFIQQHIDQDWKDLENNFDWAYNPDTDHGEWKADTLDYDVILAYPDEIIDYIITLLFNTSEYHNLPQGKYKITGWARLVFRVSGLEADFEYYEDGSYDGEVYSDSADVEFIEEESSLNELKFVHI